VCGITGYTHATRPYDQDLIARITHLISHRGPDAEGVYVSNNVSLGNVRLKIIDLEGGNQPLISPDGRTILVYNGEIYNYRELRQELEASGHQFHSQSDTEVLLGCFMQWGTDCFARVKGMFAAAFWQEDHQRLTLVRDRLGIKPLYYAHRNGQLYFGSELKVILAHPEIPRTLDLAALEQYLSLNYVPSPRTLVEGIEKLPPGHVLEWKNGNIQVWPYWRLSFTPQSGMVEAEALERLDDLLSQSIRQHLISDVPLGVLLSGGVDSSTIVHYAARHSASRLKTFSISFTGRSFNEAPYFQSVARLYGTDHHEFDLSRDLDLPGTICQFAQYADEPCGDSSSLPVWYLSKLCRQFVTVTLSGEGADELFGGYLTYQADKLAGWASHVPEVFRRAGLSLLHRWWPVSEEKISLEYMLKRFLAGTFLSPLERHCYWNGAFSSTEKAALCRFPGSPRADLHRLAEWNAQLGPLNRFLCFDQHYYLADDILAKVDRMSMAHSLEVRPPFLDHEIVEFTATLPEQFKIRGSRQKYLLKRLMQGKLPDQVLSRKKMGFDIPAHDWMRRELRPLLLDVLSPEALRQTGLFNSPVLEGYIHDHLEGRINIGFHLWGLMILFLWMRKWGIQPPVVTSNISLQQAAMGKMTLVESES
jgi:asparagine synthase (glutamine-hydrolysing)